MTVYDYDTWFVYELIDPRSKAIFYIGKTATPRARLTAHKSSPESAAYERIREIRAAGHEVEMYVIGRFNTEAEAYDYEGYLIQKTKNLVNRQGYHGGEDDFVRPCMADGELDYTTKEDQPIPDEDNIISALMVALPDVKQDIIRRVLRAKEQLFDVEYEYSGITDE